MVSVIDGVEGGGKCSGVPGKPYVMMVVTEF